MIIEEDIVEPNSMNSESEQTEINSIFPEEGGKKKRRHSFKKNGKKSRNMKKGGRKSLKTKKNQKGGRKSRKNVLRK